MTLSDERKGRVLMYTAITRFSQAHKILRIDRSKTEPEFVYQMFAQMHITGFSTVMIMCMD
jgi:hypothetical protein